ncbi:hypothetical protein [Undibacterium sp.]|uniref:hypothetical protein n=1 Tax=Undibacterium sp. TaxID=1914977 RepID=UPI002730C767|nr:hypothetical protein [Undibacterium sp.]MDP1979152.1 hypothetical protein [Undibacterium sp.]
MTTINTAQRKSRLAKSGKFTLKSMSSAENVDRVRRILDNTSADFNQRAERAATLVKNDFFGVWAGPLLEVNKPARFGILNHRRSKTQKK